MVFIDLKLPSTVQVGLFFKKREIKRDKNMGNLHSKMPIWFTLAEFTNKFVMSLMRAVQKQGSLLERDLAI